MRPTAATEAKDLGIAVPGWEAVGNINQTFRVYQGSAPVTVSFTNQPIPIPITPIAPQVTG